ncbi:chromosome segregation protein SMC [Aliidiomarina taiwanensis]|uniref:Chromosome partition protein Smc n=1 Tax=Aliidiomarina taiwanensis TaxID=946228 RepID=A0A432X1V4_9GAMM|nr:AAA family ATPase [Aliidiomarina taiwanensis]RUO40502.1 chromosome segregation protein SMC [Aliidiomarina taiwanensis]
MRLKYIRLTGFKSFVDSTKVAFPEQMTCIVGPNGCGKSNVIDAVRWVLGESSAKNLRGDAMTDVIFNGSTARKPVSQASVELVFDNTERRLQGEFADYNEVSVKRQVSREGQSVYFLNGTKCRRRDITDLFLGTGLGPRSYAIIEQGMISRLIESRPQELRVFIEEAAGISKYKERRKETENRIARTRENLERLTDVREELGKQLAKLQRQAASARRYQTLKAEERRLRSELQALRWLHYQQQCDRVEQELTSQEVELEKWQAEQRGSERGQTELREQEQALQDTVEQTQAQFYQVSSQVTSLEQDIRYQRQLAQQRAEQAATYARNATQLAEELAAEQALCDELQGTGEDLQQQLLVAEEQSILVNEQREEADMRYQDWREDWQSLRDTQSQLTERSAVLQAERRATTELMTQGQQRRQQLADELATLQHQDTKALDVFRSELEQQQALLEEANSQLAQLQEQQQGYEQASQTLQQQEQALAGQQHQLEGQRGSVEHLLRSQEPQELPALKAWLEQHPSIGVLRDFLQVPNEWLAATETLLQHWLAAPVFSEQPSQWPVAVDRPLLAFTPGLEWPTESLALQLGAKAQQLALLQGVAVATDEATAKQLLEQPEWHTVALTDGRVLGRGWVLGRPDDADSQLVWQQEAERLDAALAELKTQRSALAQELAAHQQVQAENASRLQQVQQQVNTVQQEVARSQERLLSAERDFAREQARKVALEEEQHTLEERWLALMAEQESIEQRQIELEQDEADYGPRIEAAEQRGETLQQQLQSAQQAVVESQQQVHRLQLESQQVQSKRQHLEQQIQRLKEQQERLAEQRQALSQETDTESEVLLLEEQLAEALLQREDVEQRLLLEKESLAAVQERLGVLQKGQSAVLEQIVKQRERVEASKLELAASRERGHALLDTFNELGVSLKDVLANLPEEAEEKKWQQALDTCSSKIAQLGAINLAAIEEVEAQAERQAYLDAQHEDLQASLDILEEAIKKIDRETRTRFKHTFDQVNADLQRLFPKVFSGGMAYLELTDDDLLETGVTIMARPPGKKNSTIHLLSGGEKALTALALVFAIFRLNPAPFCLLDEVDAPLDDINVGRFCRLVQEMSESVQFIYISHNKIAMEMATHLVGVTMQEPGVSRLVAVDVEEALAIADAT